jgi:hypothetical protein
MLLLEINPQRKKTKEWRNLLDELKSKNDGKPTQEDITQLNMMSLQNPLKT